MFVIDIKIIEEKNNIKIYNCGVLIIEETLTIIEEDLYQIEVLRKVLRQVEDIKRLVA